MAHQTLLAIVVVVVVVVVAVVVVIVVVVVGQATRVPHMYLIEILVYFIGLENIRGPCAMYGGVTHGHSIGAEMNMC